MFDIFDFSIGTFKKCHDKEWIILKTLGFNLFIAVEKDAVLPAPVYLIKSNDGDDLNKKDKRTSRWNLMQDPD